MSTLTRFDNFELRETSFCSIRDLLLEFVR